MAESLADGQGTQRDATSRQLLAVYAAMRILAEDDRERGTMRDTFVCTACRRHRSKAGAINYAAAHLCNGCATDFEVLRLAGMVANVEAYLRRERGAATTG